MGKASVIFNLGQFLLLGGVVLLLVGLGGLFIAPMEIAVCAQFQEGGRFAYEGFGFGSLMFGNVTVQVSGYYFIALICMPLGYGHLRLHRWLRPVIEMLLDDWLVLGMPLMLVAFAMLQTAKALPTAALPFLAVIVLLLYPLLPLGLRLFYRSRRVRMFFDREGSGSATVEDKPMPHLVLGSLLAFFGLFLYLPLLFNGAFPFFGRYLFDRSGLLVTQLAIVILIVAAWGMFRGRPWAWWGALLALAVLVISASATFLGSTPADLFAGMHLAETEREILDDVPPPELPTIVVLRPASPG